MGIARDLQKLQRFFSCDSPGKQKTGLGFECPGGMLVEIHEDVTFWMRCIYLGKFHHELTTSEPWKSWFLYGKSSPFMALIQISEIL